MFGEHTPQSMLILLMCGFVAFFAFSLGPIKFVFASEIFPTNIRSHAMSVVILSMWAADTLVGQLFPMLRDNLGPSITFLLFAGVLAPQILLVWRFMPETAGRSLEDGNVNGAVGPLEAFIHHVEALKGKKIEEGCADALVECAKGVIEGIS